MLEPAVSFGLAPDFGAPNLFVADLRERDCGLFARLRVRRGILDLFIGRDLEVFHGVSLSLPAVVGLSFARFLCSARMTIHGSTIAGSFGADKDSASKTPLVLYAANFASRISAT